MTFTSNDYAALRPDQLAERIAAVPVAYVPWGALEWHSFHLPVGLDGFTAEHAARRAAERTGGMVLPAMFLPITALPHPVSISFKADTVRAVLDDLLAELARVGFQVVVILSGHYAQGHELVLMDAAEAAMQQHGIHVLTAPPLALLGEEYLDHAGRWETAQMLAIDPQLVDLDRFRRELAADPQAPVERFGVLGPSPTNATTADGEQAIEQAVEQIAAWVECLLADDDHQSLRELYAQRRAAYHTFLDQYFRGSHEDAAAAWWTDTIEKQEIED
jgi:creatinine amidohydrolase